MRSKQLSFDSHQSFQNHTRRFEHGAEIRKGKRKLARPFDSRKFLHVTMRSSKAVGRFSLLNDRHQRKILKAVYSYAERFRVQVIRFANAGNHLHILLKAPRREELTRFLRTVCGVIARVVTGAKRGSVRGKFWDSLAYSKLVEWGRQFKNTSNYVLRNAFEGAGVVPPRSQAPTHVEIDFEELLEEY